MKSKSIILKKRPAGALSADCFSTEEILLPSLGDGQILVRNSFLSIDPAMRWRLQEEGSYAQPQAVGEVMLGTAIGHVMATKNPGFVEGDAVIGVFGWQEFSLSSGRGVRKVDGLQIPLPVYLGAAGLSGVTAWRGVREICDPKPGETFVVSAACGAVGNVAGQLAKRSGARVVGIAGGKEKCRIAVNQLGFDACIDRRDPQWRQLLQEAAGGGIHSVFENVGGEILDELLVNMAIHGRVALCGYISSYDSASSALANAREVLARRLTLRGFIISDDSSVFGRAYEEILPLIASKQLHVLQSLVKGLESAPSALIGILQGDNVGKLIVSLRD